MDKHVVKEDIRIANAVFEALCKKPTPSFEEYRSLKNEYNVAAKARGLIEWLRQVNLAEEKEI